MRLFEGLLKKSPEKEKSPETVSMVVNGIKLEGTKEEVVAAATAIGQKVPSTAPPKPPPSPAPVVGDSVTNTVPATQMELDAFIDMAAKKGIAAAIKHVLGSELGMDPEIISSQLRNVHQLASRSLVSQFSASLQTEGVDVANTNVVQGLMTTIDKDYNGSILPSDIKKAVAEGRTAGWVPQVEGITEGRVNDMKPAVPVAVEPVTPAMFPAGESFESGLDDEIDANALELSARIDAGAAKAREEGGEPAERAYLAQLAQEA